jgi:hypothetical protein
LSQTKKNQNKGFCGFCSQKEIKRKEKERKIVLFLKDQIGKAKQTSEFTSSS